jgi:hypothetical protein
MLPVFTVPPARGAVALSPGERLRSQDDDALAL